jgi:pimeloyl-ACP methyl ester carboxylesterase
VREHLAARSDRAERIPRTALSELSDCQEGLVAGSRRRWIAVAGAVCTVLVGPQPALAGDTGSPPSATALSAVTLTWTPCPTAEAGTAAGVQCSTADLPMDYDQPTGAEVHIAVARVPATDRAHRIGSLFFNFGGPGGTSVDYLQANGAGIFADLNKRFDIVAFDPRGVGQSTPSIDCQVNQEQLGIYSQPVPTPQTLDRSAYVAKVKAYVNACVQKNGEILRHVSTANVARDMDALRAAVGDPKLSYLGFSYGTFLGATYAALFPRNYRALVLDGPIDAEQYINDPIKEIAEQTAGFEDALDRFLAACKADQVACQHFGGTDPSAAFDALIAQAEKDPIDASGYTPDPRPVDGDDIRMATAIFLYAKQSWGALAQALSEAAPGDATFIRAVVDEAFYGRNPDTGTFDPISDRYFTIGASEQRYPRNLQLFFDRGARSYQDYPHFWWNSGYAELSYALWPARDADAYAGPFTIPASSATPLVIATTHDPATPYVGAKRLVREQGNSRLLTMAGDGHTAYAGNSPCIDRLTNAYLVSGALPPPGTVCQQDVPFASSASDTSARAAAAVVAGAGHRR